MSGEKKLYCVIFEWAGKAPTMTWYRWLSRLAGVQIRDKNRDAAAKAGGKKKRDLKIFDELSQMVESDDPEHALYAQEGAILCASESLAKTIYGLLQAGFPSKGDIVRPRDIVYGELDVFDVDGDPDIEKSVARIRSIFSRRGPKSKIEADFAVTCLEELQTRHIHTNEAVVNCPVCGATRIRVRAGTKTHVSVPDGDIFEAWVATRFVSGAWEIPTIDPAAAPAVARDFQNEREAALVDILRDSPAVSVARELSIGRNDFFLIMDAIFSAKGYVSEDKRQKARIANLVRYYQMGGLPSDITIAELPDSADIFDASASPVGQMVPALFLGWVQAQMDNDE